MELLSSSQNPRVKRWASLKDRKYRERYGLYLAEGIRLVRAYLEADAPMEALLFDSYAVRGDELLALAETAERRGIPAFELTAATLTAVTDTEHPQGVVAVARLPRWEAAGVLAPAARKSAACCADVVLVADGVRDPGNLGTMLRSAHAVGCRAVVVTAGSVDPFHPKVVRGSMGALAGIPALRLTSEEAVSELRRYGYRLLVADGHAKANLYEIDVAGPVAWVVGGEAQGHSDTWGREADGRAALPMPGGGESLNAAMAATVLLYETLRRRLERQS